MKIVFSVLFVFCVFISNVFAIDPINTKKGRDLYGETCRDADKYIPGDTLPICKQKPKSSTQSGKKDLIPSGEEVFYECVYQGNNYATFSHDVPLWSVKQVCLYCNESTTEYRDCSAGIPCRDCTADNPKGPNCQLYTVTNSRFCGSEDWKAKFIHICVSSFPVYNFGCIPRYTSGGVLAVPPDPLYPVCNNYSGGVDADTGLPFYDNPGGNCTKVPPTPSLDQCFTSCTSEIGQMYHGDGGTRMVDWPVKPIYDPGVDICDINGMPHCNGDLVPDKCP